MIETYTAAMLEPYSDRADNFRGELQNSPQDLDKAVAALDAEGFQIHFHAIGDRAINVAFNSLENAININGIRDSRHHISHIQVFQEKDISRFKELGVVANFQPLWAIRDEYITEHTYKKLGKKLMNHNEKIQCIVSQIKERKKLGQEVAFIKDSVSHRVPDPKDPRFKK